MVIGATFGGSRVGVVNFDKQSCPYLIRSTWRHSVGGKLEKDPGIILTCTDPRPILKAKEAEESVDLLTAPSLNSAATIPNNKIDQVIYILDFSKHFKKYMKSISIREASHKPGR